MSNEKAHEYNIVDGRFWYTKLWVYRQHLHVLDILTNGTNPLDMISSHLHVVLEYVVYVGFKSLRSTFG
jgi:hypothetical protein